MGKKIWTRLNILLDQNGTMAFLVVVSAVLLALSLLSTYQTTTFHSDDVVVQNIVRNWSMSDRQFYAGPQNFIVKMPLYFVMKNILPQTRLGLLMVATIQNVICFGLFIVSVYFFSKERFKVSWRHIVPILWLCSLGLFFTTQLINPNTRNAEIGVMFFCLSLLFKYINKSIGRQTKKDYMILLLCFTLIAIVSFSDPFFIYFFFMPLVLTLVIDFLVSGYQKQKFQVGLLIIIAILTRLIINKIAGFFGFILLTDVGSAFTTIEKLPNNLMVAIPGLLKLFNADFFGVKAFSLRAAAAILNLSIFLTAVTMYARRLGKFFYQRDILKAFLGILIYSNIFLYSFSVTATQIENARYMILVPFSVALASILLLNEVNKKRYTVIIVGIMITAVVLNIYSMTFDRTLLERQAALQVNNQNEHIISELKKQNLTTGYAGYWNAGINTFLSNNEITFIPVDCNNGTISPFKWYVNNSVFAKRADRMFIIDSTRDTHTCIDNSEEVARFGELNKVIPIDDSTRILVFNTKFKYDYPWAIATTSGDGH